MHGGRAVVRQARENPETKLLLGASGAFTFVLSAIKLPSVTGSSSHPTGTGLGAVLFRPPVMAFMGAVVLLDEPTAGLDPFGVEEMLQAVRRLEEHDTTVVISTHDVSLALGWADEVPIFGDGTVHSGPPVELLGDEELLTRARLRRPWPLALARALARDDLVDPLAAPRNSGELLAALRAWARPDPVRRERVGDPDRPGHEAPPEHAVSSRLLSGRRHVRRPHRLRALERAGWLRVWSRERR